MIYPDPCLCEEISQCELLVQRALKKHALQLHIHAYRLHVQMSPRSTVCDPVWGTVVPSFPNKPWAASTLSSPSSHLTALCHRKISVCSSQGLKVVPLCLNLCALLSRQYCWKEAKGWAAYQPEVCVVGFQRGFPLSKVQAANDD